MNESRRSETSPALARTLYGRRKGKKLRAHQADLVAHDLPRRALELGDQRLDLATLFPGRVQRFRMEIGFGGGEHLIHEAQSHPADAFIGCEPFVNGVAKLLVQIEERGLSNLRVHHGDARDVLLRLPDGALDRIDVLYPDPWPKWRQRKRRFLSENNLAEIARVLKPGGELRFATDIDDYAGWVLARVLNMPALRWRDAEPGARPWTQAWSDWPGTRYEAKAFREGRPPVYLTFEKSSS